MKLAKKIVGFLLVLSMVAGMSLVSFAETNQPSVNIATNVELETGAENPNVKGPATRVYRVQIGTYKINKTNNHLEVVVYMWGYGTDYVTFEGKRVNAIANPPLYDEYGQQVGIIWTFDCGVVTEPGKYEFKAEFTPYTAPFKPVIAMKTLTIK